ncbi:MAG: hypothetical protein ACK5JC_00585 [Bacteroidota bacterium]|jgi:hypothetical protein
MVKKLVLGVLAASSLSLFQQCKEPDAPKAEITVVDSLNKTISGAIVRITSKNYIPASTIDISQKTDLKGKAYFSFKLEAILQVVANSSGLTGTDYIQLENGKTVQKTIVVK